MAVELRSSSSASLIADVRPLDGGAPQINGIIKIIILSSYRRPLNLSAWGDRSSTAYPCGTFVSARPWNAKWIHRRCIIVGRLKGHATRSVRVDGNYIDRDKRLCRGRRYLSLR